jgi:hypothetical protein
VLIRATCSVLQKSVAKSVLLENAIDSRMRIKTTTYRDVQQKPCQFYWHGFLHITIRDDKDLLGMGPYRRGAQRYGGDSMGGGKFCASDFCNNHSRRVCFT